MSDEPRARKRLPSGIPGLDTVLCGGLLRGGMYLVMGQPGTGKTTIGNQLCFHHAKGGGNALFVTLLTEAHAVMIERLEPMSFFDAELVGTRVNYVSGYEALQRDHLDGLLALLRGSMREQHPGVLVVDGLLTVSALAPSPNDLKRFFQELQTLTRLLGCTTLLLAGAISAADNYAERTMVDGLIHLELFEEDMRSVRRLQVLKSRGSDSLLGRHVFQIDEHGVLVFPRIEALPAPGLSAHEPGRVPLGVRDLDRMARGGVERASSTLIVGPPGSGKTRLGLSFLAAGAQAGEPSMYLGFYEAPDRLLAGGLAEHLGLRRLVDAGALTIGWQAPVERPADATASRLLAAVDRLGVRRLFIDGLDGLRLGLVQGERAGRLFAALTNHLRVRGVTTVVSQETPELFAPSTDLPVAGVSAVVENIVSLRYATARGQVRRALSILKLRESGYDASVRELRIEDDGLDASVLLDDGGLIPEDTTHLSPRPRRPTPPRKSPGRKSSSRRSRSR